MQDFVGALIAAMQLPNAHIGDCEDLLQEFLALCSLQAEGRHDAPQFSSGKVAHLSGNVLHGTSWVVAFYLGAVDESGGEAVIGHCGCKEAERRRRMAAIEMMR